MFAPPLTRTNSFGVRRRVTKVNDKLSKMNEKANDIRKDLKKKYGVMSLLMEQCLLALAVLALLVVSSYVMHSRSAPAPHLTATVKPTADFTTRPIHRTPGTFRVPEMSRELRQDTTRLLVAHFSVTRPPVQAPTEEDLSPAQALAQSLKIGRHRQDELMDSPHTQAPPSSHADSSGEQEVGMEPPAPDHASEEDSFEPIQEYTDEHELTAELTDEHELTDHLYDRYNDDEEYDYIFQCCSEGVCGPCSPEELDNAPLPHLEPPPHATRVQSTFHSLHFDGKASDEEREL